MDKAKHGTDLQVRLRERRGVDGRTDEACDRPAGAIEGERGGGHKKHGTGLQVRLRERRGGTEETVAGLVVLSVAAVWCTNRVRSVSSVAAVWCTNRVRSVSSVAAVWCSNRVRSVSSVAAVWCTNRVRCMGQGSEHALQVSWRASTCVWAARGLNGGNASPCMVGWEPSSSLPESMPDKRALLKVVTGDQLSARPIAKLWLDRVRGAAQPAYADAHSLLWRASGTIARPKM
eukprot:353231-Chlamydomonas_euryale.AAC.1